MALCIYIYVCKREELGTRKIKKTVNESSKENVMGRGNENKFKQDNLLFYFFCNQQFYFLEEKNEGNQ